MFGESRICVVASYGDLRMVGLHERSDTAEIQKLTGKSGRCLKARDAQFRRRVQRGQCVRQPFLGNKEMSTRKPCTGMSLTWL